MYVIQITLRVPEFLPRNDKQQDPRSFATSAIKQIAKSEAEFQNALSEKFADMSDTIFKTLRRALPITRNKINWESIATCK